MIKVVSFFFNAFLTIFFDTQKFLKINTLSIFLKFDLLLLRICIHICFKFEDVFKIYGGK